MPRRTLARWAAAGAAVALTVCACSAPARHPADRDGAVGATSSGPAAGVGPSTPASVSAPVSVPVTAPVTARSRAVLPTGAPAARASTGPASRAGSTTRGGAGIDAAGTTAAAPVTTAGPHLVGVAPSSTACLRRPEADYVHYVAVVRVLGPAARHRWLMRVTTAAGSSGPSDPLSVRAVAGGVEYRFESTAVLPAPGHRSVALTQEQVLDAGVTPPVYHYTALTYPGRAPVVTDAGCR